MNYINDIRELIGNTPLLKLNHLAPHLHANIFAKLEYFNPGGSVKDRIGLEILNVAKKEGVLKPGATIIEATAGNTGIGLAIAAFEEGYNLKLVVPAKFAIEKQILMKALGAELIITPEEEGIEGALKKAEELLHETPNAFHPNQFENKINCAAHRKTGQEIYKSLDGKIDILVAGAGSGGTIMGIASYLKEQNPAIKIVLVDPIGSLLGGGETGCYTIEGIGNHFIPDIFNLTFIDEVEKISDEEASYYVQLLSKKEGVLAGSSSGAAIAGAIKQAHKATTPLNIVAVLPDRSDRYFSKNLYQFDLNLSDYRFNYLFDDWADGYDNTVTSSSGEYEEVFKNYNAILEATVASINKPKGSLVIDIGSGTGNLTAIVSQTNYEVIGIDPNVKMREISKKKHPHITFKDGGFLNLSQVNSNIDAIVSSYAFHHLSDSEKADAALLFSQKLSPSGKVVIADTMYQNLSVAKQLLDYAITKGYQGLAHDLQTEFYTTHEVLEKAFLNAGFYVSFKQMNAFVWILIATKISL